LSPVEFKSVEWQRSKPVAATHEIEEQILQIGIRKLKRAMSVNHPTMNMILKGGHGTPSGLLGSLSSGIPESVGSLAESVVETTEQGQRE
jgi:hypothetical protein